MVTNVDGIRTPDVEVTPLFCACEIFGTGIGEHSPFIVFRSILEFRLGDLAGKHRGKRLSNHK